MVDVAKKAGFVLLASGLRGRSLSYRLMGA